MLQIFIRNFQLKLSSYFTEYTPYRLHHLILGIMIIINLLTAYYGLITLNHAPTLKLGDNTLFLATNAQHISSIGSINIDKDFFLRLPEFFSMERENSWWQMQNTIHEILSNSQSIDVQYTLFNNKTYSQSFLVSHATLSETLLLVFPIYLTASLMLANAIALTLKHRSETSFILSVFLCFFSLYFISAAPIVCRQWTLDFHASKLLIYCHYIASGGLLALVHYSMIFPAKNALIKRYPIFIPVIFYLYVGGTSFMYISGLWAFDTTIPMLVVWIVVMIINFTISIVKEHDTFLRKQIILSLIVPVLVGVFFGFLTAIPEVLGNSSLQFTLFALFSLILPFSLVSAMDNIHLYQQRILLEKDFNNEKEQVRQALHDHTLSSLGHISQLSDRLQINPQLSQMQQIGNYARTCTGQIRDFLWISGEHCETWQEFCAFMREYGYDYFEAYQIEFDFNCEISTSEHLIPPGIDIKNCLYQSFASSLSNVIQHANANTVDVKLFVGQESISLSIKDNGCGFSKTKQNTNGHYGLSNIEKRVNKLGGKLLVTSPPDLGASIILTLPL